MNNSGTAPQPALPRQTGFCRGLSDRACADLGKRVKWKEYDQGNEIIPYRDRGDSVYLLIRGSVRVTIYSYSGKEISYQDLSPGDLFGELSAIDGLPRTANVIALEPVVVGYFSGQDFRRTMKQHPEVADAVMKRLAALVRFLCDRVYQYGALDVKDRVRAEILRLARHNMTGENLALIDNMPTHADIASRVNTHREAVTRELGELSRLGLIHQDKRVLTVLDVAALSALLPEQL